MSLDLTALLAAQRAIKVARADYDFARDGGALGEVALASGVVPAGSLILGSTFLVTAAMVFATTGNIIAKLGASYLGGPPATLDYVRSVFWYDAASVVTDVDRALSAVISNDVCTAGAFTLWVYYLPTTG